MQISTTEQAIENFQKNIEYFQKEQPAVANRLAEYESAVEKHYYTPKYEIIQEHSYFDVLEPQKGTKLYASSSLQYAEEVAQSINFKKDENLYKTFKEHPLDIPDTQEISPLLHYIQEQNPQTDLFEKIEKFIFFGIGLGTHLISVDAKINASSYLFVEDDLELFRLSLFTTPYYSLAQKAKLFFSIFEDASAFKSTSQQFINYNFYQNQYIKFFTMLNHSEEKIRLFHIQVVSQSQNLFFYDTILSQYIEPLDLIQKEYNFVNLLHDYSQTPLAKTPVILLAAGPSLQKNIALVKKFQDSCIVVALSSVLSTVEKEGIIPDILTHMDGFEPSTEHFKKLNSLEFLQNTLFLFSARSPRYVIELFDKERVFLYENGTTFRSSMGNLSAACVGSTTYLLLLALGVKELYLVGLDLALDQESGMTHSSEHEFAQQLSLESTEDKDLVEFKKELIEIEGNFREKVKTKVEFALSVDSINAASLGFKKEEQNVYNLNDGAKFANTFTLPAKEWSQKEFPLLDKTALRQELLSALTQVASNQLTQEEKTLIEQKAVHIQKLLSLIESQKMQSYTNDEQFFQDLMQLFTQLSQNQEQNIYDISLILQEFFKYIYPFIYDFLNTAALQNKNGHIEKINIYLCEALHNILQKYLTAISFIKQT